MKVAVVGSRNLTDIALEQYISQQVQEIVSAVLLVWTLALRNMQKAGG